MTKEITINVDEDIVETLADILCYFAGYSDAKDKENWRSQWIMDSVDSLRSLRIEIESEIKNNKQ